MAIALIPTCSFAQESNFVDTLVLGNQAVHVNTDRYIIPTSVLIESVKPSRKNADIQFEVSEDSIYISYPINSVEDTFRLSYRYLASPLFENQALLDTALIVKDPASYYDLSIDPGETANTNPSNRDLNYSGSFARGFSIGNRQDLVLNSDLDLQLSGKIGGEIDILAAISDQNIPLQPEGNTQNLREFDKVFIQLSKDKHRLLLGDYEVQSDSTHFLNFFKKWQGVKYDDEILINDKGTLSLMGAAAVSRGQYQRNTLQVQEGNQGPYRLEGADGESFIIIIAATERVYLDGVLLTRGVEKDYIIDYNTAEVTFTPNLLITKDVRITVDFEYNNQRYLRTGAVLNADYSNDKTRIYGSYYQEQDSRNTNGVNSIDVSQKQQLGALGDNLENQFGSSIAGLTEEDLDPVAYLLTDTLVNGIRFDSVLVFTNEVSDELMRFSATFSFVGTNGGNYILSPGSSNGTIFQWIAPIDGVAQGDYKPIVQLVAPQKTALLTVGATHALNKKWSIGTEVAASNQDLNRFSNFDSGDNLGLSLFTFLDYTNKQDSAKFQLDAGFNYEFVHENFATINPFRNAEFNRDWNLKSGSENAQQHLANGYFQISKDENFRLKLQSEFLDNATGVNGFRQSADLFYTHKGLTLFSQPSFLKSQSPEEEGTFWRPNFDISQSLGNTGYKLGVVSLIEHRVRKVNPDSLSIESSAFSRYEAYLENDSNRKLHSRVSLARRVDELPSGAALERVSTATELNIRGHWNSLASQQLNWNFSARNLRVDNPQLLGQTDLQTYLGKLTYTFQLLKGVIRSTTAYELGAGQENKRSFIYLEVEPGKGIYQWVDYNEDEIQQLEEFEIAPNIDQATFIRIERPTNEFIKTQNVLFNQNLQLGLKPIWFNEKGMKKFISKFSTTTNIQINRKNNNTNEFQFWNPFDLSFESDAIVTAQSLVRNNLYYNRGNPNFSAYLGHSNVFSAQALDIGDLRNRQIENYAHYQVKLFESINHTLDFQSGTRLNDASLFESRNYELETFRFNPAIHFLLSNTFNATLQYAKENLENKIGEQQTLSKNEFNFILGYQNSNSRSIDLSFTYSAVDFTGNVNDPVAFTLLDGLQVGNNLEWNLTMNQRIAKNLQLLINYNGRKTGALRIVHFGNLQVKATF